MLLNGKRKPVDDGVPLEIVRVSGSNRSKGEHKIQYGLSVPNELVEGSIDVKWLVFLLL